MTDASCRCAAAVRPVVIEAPSAWRSRSGPDRRIPLPAPSRAAAGSRRACRRRPGPPRAGCRAFVRDARWPPRRLLPTRPGRRESPPYPSRPGWPARRPGTTPCRRHRCGATRRSAGVRSGPRVTARSGSSDSAAAMVAISAPTIEKMTVTTAAPSARKARIAATLMPANQNSNSPKGRCFASHPTTA